MSGQESDPGPGRVANTVPGVVSGPVAQIGTVHGNVEQHHHEASTVVPEVVAVVTRLAPGPASAGVMFVGRGDEVERLLASLTPHADTSAETDVKAGVGPVVVSAVAGMGGVGKTALARHCAHLATRNGWFHSGVFWVDMQGYSPDGVVTAAGVFSPLLRHLGLPADQIPLQAADRVAVYDRTLRGLQETGRAVLLVLDNASSAEQVRGLLPGEGVHRVVVTTRDTLDLPGARRLALDVLPTAEAVGVLDRALRRQDPDDDRAHTDPAGIEHLAGVCGGLPLALLIAAGLLTDEPALSPGVLAQQLAHSSTTGFTHGETRLAAVFTASHDRLRERDPEAAQLLRLLALTPGVDISTDAAAALADIPASRARTLLRVLRQAHLLLPAGSVDRWRMHDLIRRHTLEHHPVDDQHDDDACLTRLLDHYLHTTTDADAHLRALSGGPVPDRFTDRADALAWLDIEHPNLVAAVHHAATTGRHTHTTGLAAVLDQYLSWRRHLTDLLTVHELALTAAHHLNTPHTLATAWNNLGNALRQVRRFDEAITAHQRDLDICQELGDRHREGIAWGNLGLALQELRRFDDAITAHQHDLTICHELGDRHGEGTAWNNLGLALQEVHRFDDAITAHHTARDIHHELGDRHREGMVWNNLGLALREVRRFDDAITAHETARDIHHELGDRHGEGTAWNNLGLALRQVGRFDGAITAHQHDLTICHELGDRHGEGMAWNNLGNTLQAVRRFDDAITAHHTARDICHELGDHHREGMAWNNLGNTLLLMGRFDDARSCWEQALTAFRSADDTFLVERVLSLLDGLPDNVTTDAPPEHGSSPGTTPEH
jgi:tetratricopeptide (TPR) repeat protein